MYQAITIGLVDELFSKVQTSVTSSHLHFTPSLTVQDASRLLIQQIFHLLIVDLEYLRNIRQIDWLSSVRRVTFVPIVVLSDTPERDLHTLIHYGVDICVSSKQEPALIADIILSQLRRYIEYNHYNSSINAETAPFQVGDIYIDPARQKVKVGRRPISLRHREFSLLLYFMRNPGIVLTAGQICENAWGMEYAQPIDRAIHELRKQIESNPRQPCYIQTVHRVGYRFTAYSSGTCER